MFYWFSTHTLTQTLLPLIDVTLLHTLSATLKRLAGRTLAGAWTPTSPLTQRVTHMLLPLWEKTYGDSRAWGKRNILIFSPLQTRSPCYKWVNYCIILHISFGLSQSYKEVSKAQVNPADRRTSTSSNRNILNTASTILAQNACDKTVFQHSWISI